MSKHNSNFRWLLSRRDFLKTALASGIALAGGALGLPKLLFPNAKDSVSAVSGPGPYYWGGDTSWPRPDASKKLPRNFYIGRTGIGASMITNALESSFSQTAAQEAGTPFTHTYWLVKGPLYYYRPSGVTTDYQWGQYQGQKACNAFFDSPHSGLINGFTIFADIEEGRDANGNVCNDNNDPLDDGFVSHPGYNFTQSLVNRNRQVLEGFIDGVYSFSRGNFHNFIPGVYTNFSIWRQWFGGARYYPQWFGQVDYQTGQPFVLWLAGGNNGVFPCITCAPCSDNCSASETQSQAIEKFQTIRSTRFGNVGTVIWQYYIKAYPGAPSCPESCGDWDIASQNGHYWFYPLSNWLYLPAIMSDGSGGGGMTASIMSGYPAPSSDTSLDDFSETSPDDNNPYPAPNNQ